MHSFYALCTPPVMHTQVQAANQKLKAGGVRVKLYQRSDDGPLYLIGTFPPKPQSQKDKPYQQKISLGMQPHTQGIKRAVQEAKRVSLLLEKGEFDWSEWIGDQSQVSGPPVGELAARYEQWFFATKGETASTKYTWEKDYLAVYRKIPNDAHLTEEFIISFIQSSSDPNTRSRKRYTQAMKKLAEFAELPIRMKKIQQLSGNYGRPGTLKPRKLLTDQEIIEIWSLLDNPIAKYVWGLMACFGCRSHEVWFVDTSALLEGGNTIQIPRNTKSKRDRTAYALPRAWLDQFELRVEKPLPEPDPKLTNGALGDKITHLFTNKGLPGPYILRHCWKQRAIRVGIDPSVAARSLGHSVSVSQQTYSAWLADQVSVEAFDRVGLG